MPSLHDRALAHLAELERDMSQMTAQQAGVDHTVAGMARLHIEAFRRLILHHQDYADPAGADERADARRETFRRDGSRLTPIDHAHDEFCGH